MKHQAYNPFLPLWEYIPDGEPHVFGDRLYLFGSHDVEGGERYCAAGNYVGWSAPLDDLSDWRYEGVLYTAAQDPRSDGALGDLYAPDVVRGNDGRYYQMCIRDSSLYTMAAHNACSAQGYRFRYPLNLIFWFFLHQGYRL